MHDSASHLQIPTCTSRGPGVAACAAIAVEKVLDGLEARRRRPKDPCFSRSGEKLGVALLATGFMQCFDLEARRGGDAGQS
jgi:hypothetical protein